MYPKHYPEHVRARTAALRLVFTWRHYRCSNLLHFVATRDLGHGELDSIVAGFYAWFNSGGWPFGRPNSYLPYTSSLPADLILEIVSHAGVPVLSSRFADILNLEGEDSTAMAQGSAIMLRWETSGCGHSSRGRTFLGPVSVRALDSDGVGQISTDYQDALSLTWSSITTAAPEWLVPEFKLRPAILHAKPAPGADDPDGWYSYVQYGYIADRTLRSLSRRSVNVSPVFNRDVHPR